jgi:phosphoglycerate dehydrogenase-like enzyme
VERAVLVLVPDDDGVAALAAVPGVRALRYEPDTLPTAEQRDAEVIVVGHLGIAHTTRGMAELPRLRLVQTLNAGYEQWVGRIPPGVRLANARGAHGRATAEWVVAVLLAHVRELHRFAATQAAARWVRGDFTGTFDGRRVAVLGAGDIGGHLRAMLTPLGADVQLVGRTARAGVLALPELLADRAAYDVVILVLPLTDQTRGLVDAEFLAGLRDGAIVVNAGRGPLVVTDDLRAAAAAGRVTALLDVVDPEPLPDGHPLWTTPGVTITPHVGGAVAGIWDRAWRVAAEQIAAYARGEDPPNLVDV